MVSQNSIEVFVDGIALLKGLSREKKKKCLTIGITGATRSGKSTLAKMFKKKFGCSLLHQDNYCNELKVQK
jgi:uridine kinase